MTGTHSCEYCDTKNLKRHFTGCPEGDTGMIVVWNEGRLAAVTSRANPHPEDETFTLGYLRERRIQRERSRETTQVGHEDLTDAPSLAGNQPTPAQIVYAIQDRKRAEAEASPY